MITLLILIVLFVLLIWNDIKNIPEINDDYMEM